MRVFVVLTNGRSLGMAMLPVMPALAGQLLLSSVPEIGEERSRLVRTCYMPAQLFAQKLARSGK
jgi:hypothetical protein